ncbi:MAG: hypothetical protein K2G89_02810, partial [Lachnospiraceae bacterium]|nr:hypothetical protein [Lachnospiraceae bacterium]
MDTGGNIQISQRERRRRIMQIKKIIIYTVLVLLVVPAISAVLLLDKVSKLESRYEYLVEQDINTLLDSAGAFAENPNATVAEGTADVSEDTKPTG